MSLISGFSKAAEIQICFESLVSMFLWTLTFPELMSMLLNGLVKLDPQIAESEKSSRFKFCCIESLLYQAGCENVLFVGASRTSSVFDQLT